MIGFHILEQIINFELGYQRKAHNLSFRMQSNHHIKRLSKPELHALKNVYKSMEMNALFNSCGKMYPFSDPITYVLF